MEAIKFEKVNFSYGGEEKDSFALRDVSFSVEEGEFVAVLGHNGSGKSTLARLVDGLLSPSDGKISVLGLDAAEGKNTFEIRKNVGIVFQNPDNQTVASIVEDDIAFGPENIGIPREEIGRRISFALDAVGMSEFRHSTPSRLSGGQKQRIAIAGVLALKPKIMILDESTAMLDPRGRKEVTDVVLKLNREEKITVLLITHFPEEAMLADRAIVMNRGEIVMQGKPADILCREDELETFNLTLPRPVQICRDLRKRGRSYARSVGRRAFLCAGSTSQGSFSFGVRFFRKRESRPSRGGDSAFRKQAAEWFRRGLALFKNGGNGRPVDRGGRTGKKKRRVGRTDRLSEPELYI